MSQTITAIYEDGVFKPLQKVNIKPHQKAELIIFPEEKASPLPEDAQKLVKAQKKALRKLCGIGNSGLSDIAENHDKYLYQKE